MKRVCYRVTADDYVDVWFDVTDEEYDKLNNTDPNDVIPYFDEKIRSSYDRFGGLELDYHRM